MRALAKLLTALVLCLCSLLPAYAAPLGYDVAILNGPPCAFPGSAIDLNFQLNAASLNCHGAGSATGLLTLTRTTVGYAQYQSGCWQQFPSGAFRITDKGLLVEEARTNSALSERDLTNAAWVKVNMTTALTATGIDCTANTATTLTAAAGNATALQTIVLGSAAYVFQPFIKRISGTGNVDITVDGGVTWTTQTLTTSYQQFQVTKTAANPVIGIRIVTNGDSVALDMGELQNGTFATSPVGSAATRNSDLVQVTNAAALLAVQTSASAFFQTFGVGNGVNLQRFLALGSTDIIGTPSSVLVNITADNTNFAPATIGGAGTMSGTVKSAFGMDNTSVTAVANGGTKVTQATSAWATNAVGAAAYLGNASGANRALNGYLQRDVFAAPKGLYDNRTSP